MSFSETVKPRYVIAITALAVIATSAILIGEAGAATSGGIGTVTSSGGAGGEASNQRLNDRYNRIWEGTVSPREKRWAERTAECESGGNPDAIGGGGLYRGAFQFMRSTWKASPKSPGGDPIAYPYRTQAVVAVLLMRRDGAGHWPVCGH
jgi:hypothetical protein